MTYKTRAGRQFVVIATGAGPDGTLAAFALPRVHGAPTAPVSNGPSAIGQPADAATAFAAVCQPCHGRQGRNGIAPALVPMRRTANEVLAIVREGVGQMPPVSPRELSDQQVVQIVEYLRSLGQP
jgi:mono/diheme cytochrome c family protein